MSERVDYIPFKMQEILQFEAFYCGGFVLVVIDSNYC